MLRVADALVKPLALLQLRPLRAIQDELAAKRPAIAHHLTIGWWSVAIFGLFGLGLETLHGFKASLYVDVGSETRRLMWTLAHAHGTLLGILHIGYALSLPHLAGFDASRMRIASRALVAASLLLPGGFFLGGVRFYAGDPGVGVALVPIGAVLLIFAAVLAARAVRANPAR
jgi:hypothetical protein